MTEKKRENESWESFSERLIREAQHAGAFDNLPGFGKPIPGIGEPDDENWWIRDKLRREQIRALPPILEARLERERTLEALDAIASEREVRKVLTMLNEKIRQAHYSHIAGPTDGVLPVDIDAAVADWRNARQARDKV